MRKELLIGAGSRREKILTLADIPPVFTNLVTLDLFPEHKPDVVHDLNVLPYPFEDEEFDEIHAYEVLEHCGKQGDFKFFFDQFAELHRILKPKGYILGSVPCWDSEWAWADPGHTRIIAPKSLMFLEQQFYDDQVGKTACSDYRPIYKANLRMVAMQEKTPNFFFILQKV